jgi:hypothetical protein
MIFLICLEELHSLEAPNSFVFQLQLEGGYNLREAPTPQFSGYNQKETTTPYVLQIQPEGVYKHLSFPHTTTLK